MSTAPGIVYIAGAGHSGSSLFDRLLGHHPKIASGGEWHRLSLDSRHRICGCGISVDQCEFWGSARSELGITTFDDLELATAVALADHKSKYGERIVLRIRALVPASRELFEEPNLAGVHRKAAERSWDLLEAVARVHDVQWLVDSTKNPQRMLDLASVASKEGRPFRVLHLVRDGRKVAASEMRRAGTGIAAATLRWVTTNLKVEAALRAVSCEHMRIRYEDLCSRPPDVLSTVARWLMPAEASGPRYPDDDHDSLCHAVPGNPTLRDPIGAIRVDERWRQHLRQPDRLLFEVLAGTMNRRYGYRA